MIVFNSFLWFYYKILVGVSLFLEWIFELLFLIFIQRFLHLIELIYKNILILIELFFTLDHLTYYIFFKFLRRFVYFSVTYWYKNIHYNVYVRRKYRSLSFLIKFKIREIVTHWNYSFKNIRPNLPGVVRGYIKKHFLFFDSLF